MAQGAWQRRHVNGVLAVVTPVPGIGSWEVCLWQPSQPSRQPLGRYFSLLTEAQAAADFAVTAHDCSVCQPWVPVERGEKKR